MNFEEWKGIVELIEKTKSLTTVATNYIASEDDQILTNLENILNVIQSELSKLSENVRKLPVK